jgi:hypothetical protein
MGYSIECYLGPFVSCNIHVKTIFQSIKSCSNKSCSKYSKQVSDNFCPNCGNSIETSEVPIEGEVPVESEVLEILGDSLYIPILEEETKSHVWLPNQKIPGTRNFHIEEFGRTVITSEQITEEKSRFSDFYEKELVILRQEYGENEVFVNWGFVRYTM